MIGRMQGDRKETIPARKATPMFNDVNIPMSASSWISKSVANAKLENLANWFVKTKTPKIINMIPKT